MPAQHNKGQAIANDVEHIEYTVDINQDRMLHAENELRPCCRVAANTNWQCMNMLSIGTDLFRRSQNLLQQ